MHDAPPPPQTPRQKADAFLAVADAFRLGRLPTEARHPRTGHLAQLARSDVDAALTLLHDIDVDVLEKMLGYAPRLAPLAQAMQETLAAGHRIFFYGCGATGRLSISLDYLWRYVHRDNPAMANRVLGFMSGGDLALVHSIESFEDHPEWGAQQLREIGFGPHDLLVSTTEGGETPSVIGATEEAARLSSRPPFFLYCNPEDLLTLQVERSRRVIADTRIHSICLDVGPMYLSGSTRLQASTVLMLAAGEALFTATDKLPPPQTKDLLAALQRTPATLLATFTQEESRLYQKGDFLLYETVDHGITILTDTTERAPTFSVLGFENQNNPERKPSLSYLRLPQAATTDAAWRALLLRDPITIEWPELRAVAGHDRLLGFDFSAAALTQRQTLTAPHNLHRFIITRTGNDITLKLNDIERQLDVTGLHPLHEHLLLKILLNAHSTLVMGRIGRFESNVMTWVKPSNNKLIDRAIRYVEFLLAEDGITGFSYEDICYQLFIVTETLQPDQSVVLLTHAALKAQAAGDKRQDRSA